MLETLKKRNTACFCEKQENYIRFAKFLQLV